MNRERKEKRYKVEGEREEKKRYSPISFLSCKFITKILNNALKAKRKGRGFMIIATVKVSKFNDKLQRYKPTEKLNSFNNNSMKKGSDKILVFPHSRGFVRQTRDSKFWLKYMKI